MLEAFCFYIYFYFDSPTLFKTKQFWEFCHAKNSVQGIQFGSPEEKEKRQVVICNCQSLVCTAAFPG